MNTIWTLRLSCMLQIASMGVLFAFESVRMKDMGVGETMIGVILGSGSGFFIVSSLFWARLADRNRWHKKVVICGAFAFAGLLHYFAICETPTEFFLYSLGRATFMPMIAGMMPTIAVNAFGPKNRGSKFGVYRAFGSLGFILGTMVSPFIFNDIGVVARVASVTMLLSVALVRGLPDPSARVDAIAPLRVSELNPIIKRFLIAFFFIALAEPSVHGFFTAYARDLGSSTRFIGMLLGVMGLVALVSLPLMGKAIDRASPQLILSISFLAQPLRVFMTSCIGDPNFLWIPLLLHGICWGGIEVSAIVYLSSLVKEDQRSTVLSYYTATRMLGMLIGAGISGYLAETMGYVFMFRVLSGAALFGAGIYVAGNLFLSESRTGK
ncbi:MAG: MFS transporter [Opitutales bacterium]|nr:MFS transporter [Opitutales bacterium]